MRFRARCATAGSGGVTGMFPRFANYQRAEEVSCTIFVFRGANFAPRSIHRKETKLFSSNGPFQE